jgi:elongation factor G
VAGYHAFKEAFQAATPCLLEPIYIITVMVPEDHVGAILGDLSARRGHILGVEADGHFQSIRARVPQKELYHYSTVVRSLTSGRGRHAEEFSHYAEVPPELTQKILAERAKRNGSAHG